MDGFQRRSGGSAEKKKSLSLPRIERQFLGIPVRSLVTTQTTLVMAKIKFIKQNPTGSTYAFCRQNFPVASVVENK
jgi:hypothetical protein